MEALNYLRNQAEVLGVMTKLPKVIAVSLQSQNEAAHMVVSTIILWLLCISHCEDQNFKCRSIDGGEQFRPLPLVNEPCVQSICPASAWLNSISRVQLMEA